MNNTLQPANRPPEHFSKREPRGGIARFVHHPLVRWLVIVLFFAPVMAFNVAVVLLLVERLGEPLATNVDILRLAAMIPMLLGSYWLYCRVYEKRQAIEIGCRGSGREWVAGFLAAAMLVALFVGVIAALASFEILEYRPPKQLLSNFLTFSAGALLQDLVLLCVLFRLLEELTGTWSALVASLLVFGLAHAGNPNQTAVSMLLLTVQGVVLIAPFILTRRLWLSWGFHAGWNFMQAGVFGMANSGIVFPGWMVSAVEGPGWLTGGAVGLEGSLASLLADVAIGSALLYLARRSGNIVSARRNRA